MENIKVSFCGKMISVGPLVKTHFEIPVVDSTQCEEGTHLQSNSDALEHTGCIETQSR